MTHTDESWCVKLRKCIPPANYNPSTNKILKTSRQLKKSYKPRDIVRKTISKWALKQKVMFYRKPIGEKILKIRAERCAMEDKLNHLEQTFQIRKNTKKLLNGESISDDELAHVQRKIIQRRLARINQNKSV